MGKWTRTRSGWTHTTTGSSAYYGGALVQGASHGRVTLYQDSTLRRLGIDPAVSPEDQMRGDVCTQGEYLIQLVEPDRVVRRGSIVQ
jgi:hypothetical protein